LSNTLFFAIVGLGLPAMIVTTQLAQLSPQVLSSKYPNLFLNLPGSSIAVDIALVLERLGLSKCAFVLRSLIEQIGCTNNGNKVRMIELLHETQNNNNNYLTENLNPVVESTSHYEGDLSDSFHHNNTRLSNPTLDGSSLRM
jgi:hypothetical protein